MGPYFYSGPRGTILHGVLKGSRHQGVTIDSLEWPEDFRILQFIHYPPTSIIVPVCVLKELFKLKINCISE